MKLLVEMLLAHAQQALNAALSLDEHTKQALNELNGKTIALSLPQFSETLYFQIENQAVFLTLRPPQQVDLSLRAPLKDLWTLAQKVQTPTSRVEIQGNMHLAQRLGQIIQGF
ncbi:MAG TPA: SCP2 sterol-binding domain-containing protein, partial [Gammaproteobacteria bacterium]|nr:SCP2 sterol-binding domain-containing protein [Gammaproteobacteria bacterium]